jgi:hypothetical protein
MASPKPTGYADVVVRVRHAVDSIRHARGDAGLRPRDGGHATTGPTFGSDDADQFARAAERYRDAQTRRALQALGWPTVDEFKAMVSDGPHGLRARLETAGALDENGKLIPLYEDEP